MNCALLCIVLFLSVYGKSSWLPPFAMGSLIFLIVWWMSSRFSIKRMKDCILIGLMFLPAGFLSLWISNNTEYQTTFAIAITQYMRPFPIILNLSFPLFILILLKKQIRKKLLLQIGWLVYISALLQGIFIVEPLKEGDGNLTWGMCYAFVLLLLVSLIEFVHWLHEKERPYFIVYMGISLAFIYMFGGIFYALHILAGGSSF